MIDSDRRPLLKSASTDVLSKFCWGFFLCFISIFSVFNIINIMSYIEIIFNDFSNYSKKDPNQHNKILSTITIKNIDIILNLFPFIIYNFNILYCNVRNIRTNCFCIWAFAYFFFFCYQESFIWNLVLSLIYHCFKNLT